MIKVLVSGACGRMGKEVITAVMEASDMELVGAVDIVDLDCARLAKLEHLGHVFQKPVRLYLRDQALRAQMRGDRTARCNQKYFLHIFSSLIRFFGEDNRPRLICKDI